MLDLENYRPPYSQYKCKDCKFYIREGNPFSSKVILRCEKKPFYVMGQKSYHKTKASNAACVAFKNKD